MSMLLFLWVTCVVAAMFLLVLVARVQRYERTGAEAAAALLLASLPFLFTIGMPWPITVPAAVLHVWLLVLPARMLMGRLEHGFLRRSTELNAYVGIVLTLVVVALYATGIVAHGQIIGSLWLSAVLVVLVLFFGQLLWNTRHYHLDTPLTPPKAKDLPTVSLCIPARNEDHALTECLQAALASNYPKLEILVLDDCSQDTTTSIIRSFAHDGVRFVQGVVPSEGWLGKNQAMNTLAEQASGEYIIFSGVHTQVGPNTISYMVQYALNHNLQMVSALPQNREGAGWATLLPTLDYFWRLVWPVTRRHVPVSSKFWLIKATSLLQLGGFGSVSRKILPEESFARRLFNLRSYHFVMGSREVGLTTAKDWRSQVDTSLRLMYPTTKRQPLAMLGAIMVVAGLSLVPLATFIILLLRGDHGVLLWLSVAALALLTLNYMLIIKRTQPRSWLIATLLWPFAIVQEVILLALSMLLYEFGEVNWKGRNVCYPVLGLPLAKPRREQVSVRHQQG